MLSWMKGMLFPSQDRKTINDYCSFILSDYPDIVNQKVLIPERDIELQPYCGWNTSQPSKSLMFWDSFCKIKHSRYANIQEANLKNVLNMLAALYLLEMKYLSKIAQDEPDVPDRKSNLFELKDWRYRYIRLGDGWSLIDGKLYFPIPHSPFFSLSTPEVGVFFAGREVVISHTSGDKNHK